jgi:hypothetical protein
MLLDACPFFSACWGFPPYAALLTRLGSGCVRPRPSRPHVHRMRPNSVRRSPEPRCPHRVDPGSRAVAMPYLRSWRRSRGGGPVHCLGTTMRTRGGGRPCGMPRGFGYCRTCLHANVGGGFPSGALRPPRLVARVGAVSPCRLSSFRGAP